MKKKSILFILILLSFSICLFLPTTTMNKANADNSNINVPVDIYSGKYDNYTDDDSFALSYASTLASRMNDSFSNIAEYDLDNGDVTIDVIGEDQITSIVPRELFERRGSYLYIGEEYGFYINTFADKYYYYDGISSTYKFNYSEYNNHSIVMVFDIQSKLDLNVQPYDIVSFEIDVLFQCEYLYLTSDISFCTIFNYNSMSIYDVFKDEAYTQDATYTLPNSGSYVVPSPYRELNYIDFDQTDRYYIKDISYSADLFNEQERNLFNYPDYNELSDLGSFFSRVDYSFSGKEYVDGDLSNASNELKEETISYALGFIPIFGGLISTVEYMFNVSEDVTQAITDHNIDVNSGTHYVENMGGNIADQILRYGHIEKHAEFIQNTTSLDSIWYNQGCNSKIEYSIDHSAINESAYYTRLINNIGLKIVAIDNPDVSNTMVRTATYNLRQPVYKEVLIENTNNAYILSEGTNYFSFTPTYTSDYTINCNSTSNISCKINNNTITGTGNCFTARMTGGQTYNIKLSADNTSAIVVPFTVSPSTGVSNISIANNGQYLIKYINFSNNIKTYNTNNSNIVINNVYMLNNNTLVQYEEFDGFSPSSNVSLPLESGTYYILVNNNSVANNFSLSISNISSISLNTNYSVTLEQNYKYYKYQAAQAGDYVIHMQGVDVSYVRVYTASLGDGSYSNCGGGAINVSLSANEIVYYGYSVESGTASGTLSIKPADIAYTWTYQNTSTGVISNANSRANISVERGKNYIFTCYINNSVILSNFVLDGNYLNNYSVSLGTDNKTLTVNSQSKVEGRGFEIIPQNEDSMRHPTRLYVFPCYNYTAQFNGTVNTETIGFKWIYQKYMTEIQYKLQAGTITAYGTITGISGYTNGTTYTQDILSLFNSMNYTGIDAITVTFNYVKFSTEDNSTYTYYSSNHTISGSSSVNCRYGGGTGTSTSDPFKIYYLRHFNNIKYSCSGSYYYKQMNNLDFNNTNHTLYNQSFYGYYEGQDYDLIDIYNYNQSGTYIGGFCGNNHGTIRNIDIGIELDNQGTANYVGGVCGESSGTIYDVDVSIFSILEGSYLYVGGIVGKNSGDANSSSITLCTVEGMLGSADSASYVGGITGYNYTGRTISGCNTYLLLQGNSYLGGIAGRNYGTINLCYVLQKTVGSYTFGDILHYNSGSTNYVGGIAGYNYSAGLIQYCSVQTISISYIGPGSSSSTFYPCFGKIAGRNAAVTTNINQCQVSNVTMNSGTLTSGQMIYFGTSMNGYVGRQG